MKEFLSLTCPSCGGNLEQLALTRFKCVYCGNDHFISLEEPKQEPVVENGPTLEDKRIADEYRYQQFLTRKYLPLEKKAKDIGQLNLIGFASMVFFFPAAIGIWFYNAVRTFFVLREPRFDGDEDLRMKIQTQLWISIVMGLVLFGGILLILLINVATTLISVLT